MSETETGFKVVDRRRFTSEGQLKSDAAPDRELPKIPEKEVPKTAKPTKPATSTMDFMSFVASLATNALAALGALPEARARGLPVNVELGREYIEILAMLQDKTQGNLTAEEETALKRMVSELRLHYVELVKRQAKIPAQP